MISIPSGSFAGHEWGILTEHTTFIDLGSQQLICATQEYIPNSLSTRKA